MREMKHTKGPWEVKADPCHYDSLTTVVAGEEKRKGLLRELTVEVGGWADIEKAEANALLIAAAPELLEVLLGECKEVSAAAECFNYVLHPALGCMCIHAKDGDCKIWSAICKATGHAPT